MPVATVLAGPLADHVFEPQAAAHRGLVGLLAPIVGTGRGSGMAAMLFVAGLLGAAAALIGLASTAVRQLDSRIPDLDQTATQPTGG
jgi:hypothetical protein